MAATAALQQSVGGLPSQPSRNLPDFPTRSFTAVLQHSNPQTTSTLIPDAVLLSSESSDGVNSIQGASHEQPRQGTHKGFPALHIPETRWLSLAKTFKWSLVGKFSQGFNKQKPELGRPSIKDLQRYFSSLDLKGDFSLGLLDNRHLLIQLVSEEDFLRLYSRMIWRIGKITMRIFKWTPSFHVQKESSLVPVWMNLPRLPIHLFGKDILFHIASLVGVPLRIDASTVSLKRPSVARVQIEIDLLRPRPEQIWIGYGDKEGFWQKIVYEDVPFYCQRCWHVGHDEQSCWIQNPSLKDQQKQPLENPKEKQSKLVRTQPKYVEKVQKKTSVEEVVLAVENKHPEPHQKSNALPPVLLGTGASTGNLGFAQEIQCPTKSSSEEADLIVENECPENTVLEFPLPVVFCGDGSSDDEAMGSPLNSASSDMDLSIGVDNNRKVIIDEPEVGSGTEIALQAHSSSLAYPVPDIAFTFPILANPVENLCSATIPMVLTQPETAALADTAPKIPEPDPATYGTLTSPIQTHSKFAVPAILQSCSLSMSRGLNFEAEAWFPEPRVENTGRILPPSLAQDYENHNWAMDYAAEYGIDASNTLLSGEEEDEEDEDHDSMEDYQDSQSVRDDLFLEQRKTRQKNRERRDRDMVLMRRGRGRGRPFGSRTRTYFDYADSSMPRQSSRINKGVPPKHYDSH